MADGADGKRAYVHFERARLETDLQMPPLSELHNPVAFHTLRYQSPDNLHRTL